MSREKQCECCHEWWYDSDVKENLCPNCYDYFKQLKQQLKEKDKQIKKRVMVYEKQFIVQTNEIYSLKQQLVEKDKEIKSLIADYEKRISREQELMSNMEHQLTEKQNTIDEINKEFVQAVHDWKVLCAEKDKEISKLQASCQQVKTQLAIQELEKVKEEMDLNGNSYCEIRQGTSPHNPTDYAWFNYVKFRNYLNQQIKELKGE